jgi:cysteine desulfurase family protein (TIGR01976 family)
MACQIASTADVTLSGSGRYDVDAVRAHFPALNQGAAHFDGPGGSLVPDVVGDAVRETLIAAIANRGQVTAAERTADETVIAARRSVADLLAADERSVVFGRSMTQLTFDISRALARTWRPGDEVVVTRLDHDANVRPWVYAAQAAGVTVRWAGFDRATSELTVDDVAEAVNHRTRLVAVTGASNLLGTRPSLDAISRVVHSAGALLYVDGVHLTAHVAVDMNQFGADFLTCSPYKFLGPHCGVLAGRLDVLEPLRPDKLLPAPNSLPERFEYGTLPYELLAGTTAAIDFIASLCPDDRPDRRQRLVAAMAAVEGHEHRLRRHVESGLSQLRGVVNWSRASRRTPTLLITFEAHRVQDAYRFLAARNVNAPAGSFYAYEPARWLGLEDEGGLRIGFAPYNNDEDVDRLLDGLAAFLHSG